MQLSQLRIFVALVETGSFTEAAFSIDLTQSAVSHGLAALEKELGVTLLERDRQGRMRLSNVGQKVLRHAQEVLTHIETIQQEAAQAQSQIAGKLRLGSTQFISPRLLAGILACFQQQYPRVEVILFESTGQEVYEWVGAGVVDVGFVPYDGRNIESTLVISDEIHALLPEEHPFRQEKAISSKKLNKEKWIMPKTECAFYSQLGLGRLRNTTNIRYSVSDRTTILAMVREGLGVSLIARTLLPEKLEGVTSIPLNPPEYMRIGLAVRSQDTASPAAQLFIQAAQTWSQQHGFLPHSMTSHNVQNQATHAAPA